MSSNQVLENIQEPAPIVASMVPEGQRFTFLPQMLDRYFLTGELLVYSWMERLCPDYDGGYWEFYRLSNGSFFMAMPGRGLIRMEYQENYFEGYLSREAAGIVATLYALCQLANDTKEVFVSNRYHQLLDYARDHDEAGTIFRAID